MALPPKTVLLLGQGNHRACLAFARSMGRMGCRSVVGTTDPRHFLCSSRFIQAAALPDIQANPTAYLDAAREVIERYRVALIVPIDDAALGLLSDNRDALPQGAVLAAAPAAAVRSVLSKAASVELAEQLGVPVPATVRSTHVDDVSQLIGELGLPIVAKHADPDRSFGGDAPSFRMHMLRHEADVSSTVAANQPLIFQQFVRGEHRNVCCFAVRGEVVASHEYVSLRRRARVAVLREVTAPDPDLDVHVQAILGQLRWDGIALLQFLVDRGAGKVWYLETNGRPWASIQGSVNAGWDFPKWCFEYFVSGIRPDVPPIRIGSRTRDHAGDLEALLDFLRGGPSPTPNVTPSRSRAILDYLGGFSPAIRSDVFDFIDPVPGIRETAGLAARAMKRIVRRR